MIIKKLELNGFKSFSERTRILFHPGITAVIGPNGTGKSNLVDGMLWTLRGRRLRSQRSESGGDYIFNGNAERAPMSMADVSVILGEGKASDQEDLIINHRLFRSGESEYRLNGKACRLKDIQEELHRNGIGDTDYFVIEQGNIGLFLTSKPVEKRVLLEEAAGTAYYKDKKRQAQNKLESSEQNLLRLEDIILEVDKATNSLKRQAQAAIRYRKLREHIRGLTLSLFRRKIALLEDRQREAALHFHDKYAAERGLIDRIKAEEKNLAERRREAYEEEKGLKRKQDELYALKSRLSRTEADKEREEKRLDYFAEKQISAETELGELSRERDSLDVETSEVEKALDVLQEKLKIQQKSLEASEKEEQSSSADIESREQRLEELRQEHLKILSEQTEAKNQAARHEKELELTARQEDRLLRDAHDQSSLLEEQATKLKKGEAELESIRREIAKERKKLEDRQAEHAALERHSEELESRRNALRDELRKHVHHLHALEKLKDQEARSAERPKLPEAMGQLADFIEGSKDHTALIDVFYKEEARAVLVRARDMLEVLGDKSTKGKFLLLHPEKYRPSAPALYEDSRVLGMLKAHIQAQESIKPQLSALQDAAIVRHIQDAVALWIEHPQYNYISLLGDLLLSSGLLKIGEKKDGLISLKRDIKLLKQDLARKEAELSPLDQEFEETERRLETLKRDLLEANSRLAGLEQREGLARKEVAFARSGLDQTRSQTRLLEDEAAATADERQNINRVWSSLTSRVEELERREKEISAKIRSEEEALSGRRQQNDRSRNAHFQLRSEVNLLQEKTDNSRALLRRLDERHTVVQAKISELEEVMQAAAGGRDELREHIHALTRQAGRLSRDLQALQSRLAEEEAELIRRQAELQDKEDAIQKLRDQHEAAEEERVKWEVSKAERERDLVNMEEACWQEIKKTLPEIKAEVPLKEMDVAEAEAALELVKEKLQRISAVNLMAEEEYLTQKKRLDFLTRQQEDLVESIASSKEAIKKIDQEGKNQFLRALIEVNKNFQDVFAQLFQGGTARLSLSDEDNPLESGIEIIAQPPGKRVQSLNLLSGGEKSLTSLAFFFALFRYRPAPFCILDEVDAALDETNLTRFLNLMHNIKDQTQFIIITHNFKTMEVADYIYGTTMAEPNITSLYSVKLKPKAASQESISGRIDQPED